MSFLFDNLFQKQNPELASQMAKRGLVFDKRKHRWVKGTQPDANVTGGESSEIPGMEGPFRYKTGNTYYYSPKEGKYYDRGQDVFMPRGFDPHTGQYHQDIEEARREKEKEKKVDKLGDSFWNETIMGETFNIYKESTPESHEKEGRTRVANMMREKGIVRSLVAKKPKGKNHIMIDEYKNGKFKAWTIGLKR